VGSLNQFELVARPVAGHRVDHEVRLLLLVLCVIEKSCGDPSWHTGTLNFAQIEESLVEALDYLGFCPKKAAPLGQEDPVM
jgi:hypothetical protein